MAVRTGRMRHRVSVQTAVESQDDHGELIKTWTTVDTVWADVFPFSGQETLTSEQIVAGVTHRVTIRYNATVTPAARLLFGSRTLEINSVIDRRETQRVMDLMCKEVV